MKRKFLCMVLSLVCVISLISGCGSKKNEETDTYGAETEVQTENVSETGTEAETVNTEEIEILQGEQIYDFGLADTTKEGVILQAFSWSFDSIKEAMADIAAAGFTSVQTSPINACYDGDNGMQLFGDGKWYYHYQPTDYTIGNYQLGTRDEFIEMCQEADKYGIKIIVDVAPNHTTTYTDYISENLINAAGGFDKLFHENGLTTMSNYSDRLSCTTYAMGGLPDIDTENPAYQEYLLAYLNDCIACGADGFRFDAAKHIALSDDPSEDGRECSFWDVVLDGLINKDNLFTYGEVLQGDNERINAYIDKLGAATASRYGGIVRGCVTRGNITVKNMSDYICNGSTDVVLWVESHDNYINDNTYQTVTDRDVELSWAIIASRAEGTPLFFDRPYGADTENQWGTLNEISVQGSDIYKSAAVSAVNHFRNAMLGEDEKLVNPEGSSTVLLIERGTRGLVIVNVREAYDMRIETSLADGTYVDRVDGVTEYTVENGVLSCTVPEKSVIVLYNDGYIDIEAMPVISADAPEYYDMEADSVDVTLHVSGAAEGVYVLDGEEAAFTDGTVITVGGSLNEGESVKLTVKAVNDAGFTSARSYLFSKPAKEEEVVITDGMTVYFKKPANWKDTLYAYIYDDSDGGLKILKEWPGNKMKDEGDGLYSYTFESEWSGGLIMFSDGKNQYPSSNQPGTAIVADKVYTAN